MHQDVSDSEKPVSPAPTEFERMFTLLFGIPGVAGRAEAEFPNLDTALQYAAPFSTNFDQCLGNRNIFAAESGWTGLGPHNAQAGDVVAILYGDAFCFILRPKNEYFELIGRAYVQGIMRGKLMQEVDQDGRVVNERIFTLC